MSYMADATLVIAGRLFVLGAAYRSGRKVQGSSRRPGRGETPRRLLGHDPAFPWPGGRVEVARVEGEGGYQERRLDMSGRAWAAWARELAE